MFLHFKIEKEGSPILLIHGLFGNLSNLNVIATPLQTDHQTIQIDLPNHGKSFRTSCFTYQETASVIADFLQEQNINKVTVIGHSMGGKVAMALALLYPDLVTKLIVMDIAPVNYPTGRHDNVFNGLEKTLSENITSRKQADELLAHHIEMASVRQFLLKSLKKNENNTFSWLFDVNNLAKAYLEIMSWHIKGEYHGKTLFLKGADSDYILPKHQDAIVQQFPNSKAHIIANTGHWLHAEKPDAVNLAIRKFINN